MPLISCHLVYNYYDFLEEAIESILSQSFSDFELILVADSVDNFDYEHPKIRHLSGIGLFPCRNLALEYSDSEFIAPMDSDDLSYPFRFAKAVEKIGDYSWIGFGVDEIDPSGNPLRQVFCKEDSCSFHSTVLMRRITGTGYPTQFPVAGDVGLFFHLRREGYKTRNFREVVGARRIHPNQISKTRKAEQMQAFIAYANLPFGITPTGEIIKGA